jgi:aspartyl protease family protein
VISLRHCIRALLVFPLAGAALATDLSVVGLFPGKAVVTIDGGPIRTLSVGQKTAEGVTLISSERDSATFDIGGQKKTLQMGQQYSAAARSASAQSVTLNADGAGHFFVNGQVNGGTVRFLVDTGATVIALSASDAGRLGIDYRKGQLGVMNTANGQASVYRVRLDSVRVGDITVNGIDAVVMEGTAMPIALLGMSFLNRMEMKRDGQTMVLIRRY